MWIRCKPTNPVPKCFFVRGAASHTQEKVFLIQPMWRNVWMGRSRGGRPEKVCVWERLCASQVWICARKTQLLERSFYLICVSLCVFERVLCPFGAKAPGQRSWWSHLLIVCHSRLPPTCCFHCVSSLLFFNSSAHIFSIFFPLSFSHMLLTASTPSPLLLLVPLASTRVNFLLFTFLSVANISIFHKGKRTTVCIFLVARVVLRCRCHFFIVVSCDDHVPY